MYTDDFTVKYEIDPDKIPLTSLEVQILVALMSEYGFDREFVNFMQQKGIDCDILRRKKQKLRNTTLYGET